MERKSSLNVVWPFHWESCKKGLFVWPVWRVLLFKKGIGLLYVSPGVKHHMAEHTGKERLAKPGGGVLTVRTVCYFPKRPSFSSQSLAI